MSRRDNMAPSHLVREQSKTGQVDVQFIAVRVAVSENPATRITAHFTRYSHVTRSLRGVHNS